MFRVQWKLYSSVNNVMTKWWYYSSLNCLALYFWYCLSVLITILSIPIVSFCFPSGIDRPFAIQTHLNSVNRITSASVSLIRLILTWVSPVPRNYFSASLGPCNDSDLYIMSFSFLHLSRPGSLENQSKTGGAVCELWLCFQQGIFLKAPFTTSLLLPEQLDITMLVWLK